LAERRSRTATRWYAMTACVTDEPKRLRGFWNAWKHRKWLSGCLSKGFAIAAISVDGAELVRRKWLNLAGAFDPTWSVLVMRFEGTEMHGSPLPAICRNFASAIT